MYVKSKVNLCSLILMHLLRTDSAEGSHSDSEFSLCALVALHFDGTIR